MIFFDYQERNLPFLIFLNDFFKLLCFSLFFIYSDFLSERFFFFGFPLREQREAIIMKAFRLLR